MTRGSGRRSSALLALVVIGCGLLSAVLMWVVTPAQPRPIEPPDSFTAAVTLLVDVPPEGDPGADRERSLVALARYALLMTTGDIPRGAAEVLGYQGDPAGLAAGLTVVPDPTAMALTVSTTSPDAARALATVRAFEEAAVRSLGRDPSATVDASVSAVEEAALLPAEAGGGYVPAPGRPARVTIAAALGMLFGLSLALLTRRLDTSLRTRDDVHRAFGAPVLAEVSRPGRGPRARAVIAAADQPAGPEADRYRALRAVLDGWLDDHARGRRALVRPGVDSSCSRTRGDVILVASAHPEDSTTTVAANLAAIFAEAGRSVLVIDADLRSPRAHEVLDVPLAAGVADAVTALEPSPLADLVRGSRVHGVDLVTAGTRLQAPTPMSGSVGQLIEQSRQLADVVLVDSAPLLEVTDTVELLPLVDGVVVVVRTGLTRAAGARTADVLARFRAPVAGAVLVRDPTPRVFRVRRRRTAKGEGKPAPPQSPTSRNGSPGTAVGWLRAGVLVPGILAVAAYLLVLAGAFDNQSYNVWGALVVVPVVIALNAVLIWRAGRRAAQPWLTRILVLGFAAKLVGSMARFAVAYVVYGGAADAVRYNAYASAYYPLWRQGVVEWEWGGKQGTQYMELITTAAYVFIGPSPLAAFFVFSSAAFWGCYLMLRAVQVALPDADHRRYALLVFLLPSMLYWPSSIGKEAWLLLFLGVTSLGVAKFFAREPGALLLLLVGAAGTALIRPHIAVLLFAAITVAQLFRPSAAHATGVLSKAAGLVVIGAAAVVLSTQSAAFLGIDDFSWQAVSESVDAASGQASQGGSAFTPVPLGSPVGVPAAVVTVLFRPFPWEAGNAQMLVQSLEGLFLGVLLIAAWPRLRRLPTLMRTHPFVVFVGAYTVAYIVAFSGFGNFGILARQRVLLLPVFLVLLALPAAARVSGRLQPGDRDANEDRREGGHTGADRHEHREDGADGDRRHLKGRPQL